MFKGLQFWCGTAYDLFRAASKQPLKLYLLKTVPLKPYLHYTSSKTVPLKKPFTTASMTHHLDYIRAKYLNQRSGAN